MLSAFQKTRTFLFFAVAVAAGCGGASQSDLLTSDGGGGADAAVDNRVPDSGKNDVTIKDVATEMPPPDQGVDCPGQGFCMVPSQVCCLDTSTGSAMFSCTSADGDAGTGDDGGVAVCMALSIPCDDATDCATAGMAGDVCCVTAGANDTAASVMCTSTATCDMQGHARVCNPNGPADQCPNGKTCRMSTKTLPGYNLCL
jgi:hypothetical protein